MEKRISGHTGLLALIGSPVGHSGSPAMYNYSFEKLGLDLSLIHICLILLSSHDKDELENLSDVIYLVDSGRFKLK